MRKLANLQRKTTAALMHAAADGFDKGYAQALADIGMEETK
jgi:hypothetical protein